MYAKIDNIVIFNILNRLPKANPNESFLECDEDDFYFKLIKLILKDLCPYGYKVIHSEDPDEYDNRLTNREIRSTLYDLYSNSLLCDVYSYNRRYPGSYSPDDNLELRLEIRKSSSGVIDVFMETGNGNPSIFIIPLNEHGNVNLHIQNKYLYVEEDRYDEFPKEFELVEELPCKNI